MRRRRGSQALEFGLVLPLAVLLVAGVADWAWFLFHQMSAVIAAGRGARIAGGLASADDPEGTAVESTNLWLERFGVNPDDAEVEAEIDASTDPQTLSVTITLPYVPLVGMVPLPDDVAFTAVGIYYGHLYDP